MKNQKLKINGINLQFYLWGNPKKPKLFLFHGWLDTGASFNFLCEHLQNEFYCIAPDLRGYAQSEHGKNPLGYFFYEHVADLHAIFHHFSPHQPVRMLGHSLGGAVSGIYAGGFPDRVSHFINVEGFAFRDNPPERGPEKLRTWLQGPKEIRFKVSKSVEDFAIKLIKLNPRLPLERARFFAKYLTKKVKGGVMMQADPLHKLTDPYVLTRPIIYAFWEKITAKCLLVLAEWTEINQWMNAENLEREMEERFKHFPQNSPVITIPECGHMIHHEKPKELAEAILNFLIKE